MARDKDCFVVMTLAGALTVGKMGLVFCDLIESGIVNAIVSTGALMAHGLVEATGRSHFRYDPSKMDDTELFEAGYNRVYDSLEPETNLDHVEEVVDGILDVWDAEETVCSWKLHRQNRRALQQRAGRGILKSAYEYNVPVFVPAFSDSELGIDFALHKMARQKDKRPLLRFDPLKTLSVLRTPCWRSSIWEFLPLAAVCRGIGRNNLAFTQNCSHGAGTKIYP